MKKKRLVIHDIETGGDSLDAWSPANEANFDYRITIQIGFEDEDGSMLFYLDAASIERIQSVESNSFLSKRLILKKYDPKFIFNFITNTINLNSFSSWDDAKEYLEYYFSNEYFNYNNKYFGDYVFE